MPNTAGLSDFGLLIGNPTIHNSHAQNAPSRPENGFHSADSGNLFPDLNASLTVDTAGSLFVARATAAVDNNDGSAFSNINTFPATLHGVDENPGHRSIGLA